MRLSSGLDRGLVPIGLACAVLVALTGCAHAAPQTVSVPSTARISISDRCPQELGDARGVVAGTRDRTSLLPASVAVSEALICEYGTAASDQASRSRLWRQVALDRARAQRLAAAVHAIDLIRAGTGPVACPADFGTVSIIAFLPVDGGPAIDLWWATSGCQSMDNGLVGTTYLANPSFWRFQTVLARLIGPPTGALSGATPTG